jgi:hypothetical protein
VLEGASLLPLVAVVPGLFDPPPAGAVAGHRLFFTAHEEAVIDAATRRIAPGPHDDPLEAGHPGAHEADVVRYIDTTLSMFRHRTPKLFAGGPWSNRKLRRRDARRDHMKTFVPPDRAQAEAWRRRVVHLQHVYRRGVVRLDKQAGGDFTKASASKQDQILASKAMASFTPILFQHTIEGLYSNPEYGGNRDLVGWKEIGFPGDSMPRGYTAAEMAAPEHSVVDPTGIVQMLLDDFPKIAQALASGAWRRA